MSWCITVIVVTITIFFLSFKVHVLMHNSDIALIYCSCTLVCWLYMYYPTVSLLFKVLSIWFFTHCQCRVFGNTRRTSGGIVTHLCRRMLMWDQNLQGITQLSDVLTSYEMARTKGQFAAFLFVLHLEFCNYLLSFSNFKATKRFLSFKVHYITIIYIAFYWNSYLPFNQF